MRRTLYLLLLLTTFASAPSHAQVANQAPEHSSTKSRKTYLKHQKQEAKKAKKQQNQALKNYKKLHPEAR